MSDANVLSPEPVEATEVATPDGVPATEAVQHPAKVMRIGAMIKQLLEEVRRAPLDERGRARLADIYGSSVEELSQSVSEDLREELGRLVGPFLGTGEDGSGPPSEDELRIAQAQLVGWLEGLFHGIQATLFAQQMEARQQLEELRQRSLPAGGETPMGRPGTYL
ncbi:MAG TPA: proteasome activator [Acidimicrobiales bacterium]|nr:proteasome activator [Acidimicrobiales bacterium]